MRNRRENEMKYQLGKNCSEDCTIDCALQNEKGEYGRQAEIHVIIP